MFMKRTMISAVTALAIGCGLLAPTVLSPSMASAAPAISAPATRSDYIGVLDGFSTTSPLIRQQNLAEAVVINQTASPSVARYAVDDNYAIEGPAIVNALGSRLAPAFLGALTAGQLPKTSKLLFGDDSIVGDRVSTTKEKKHFQYPRPFEVAPQLIRRYGDGRADLYASVKGSGSFPSGHTTWGYTQAFIIAALFPEAGPQILARGAEYGYHRVVLGVHYPLDVIGGRMQAEATAAGMLADPGFVSALDAARTEVRSVLSSRLGAPIPTIVAGQQPYIATPAALDSYRQRSTFSFPPIGPTTAMTVPAGAENLIRAAHPGLSTAQLRDILVRTALPSGYPLDKTGPDGGWQRLDIARAWVTR